MSLDLTLSVPHVPLFLLSCSFVISHYDKVEPYFAMDPLLPAVFVALTPEAEFSLLCRQMPPFLTATWLTEYILQSKRMDKQEVVRPKVMINCSSQSTSQCMIGGHGLVRANTQVLRLSSLFPRQRKVCTEGL